MRFSAVQKFDNMLRFDKVTESLKVGTFWDTVYIESYTYTVHFYIIVNFVNSAFWLPQL